MKILVIENNKKIEIKDATYTHVENINRETLSEYDVIFYDGEDDMAYHIKEKAPLSMLVTFVSSKVAAKPLMQFVLATKSNLTIKEEDERYIVLDPLGNLWYEGENKEEMLEKVLNRLSFLKSITRQNTISAKNNLLALNWYFDKFKQEEFRAEDTIAIPDASDFLEILRNYSKVFHKLMGDVPLIISKKSPQVFRCEKGMPSFRCGKYVVVSKRVVEHMFIEQNDLVATFMEDNKLYFLDADKPAVDTPLHIRLYEKFKNINYIIHSHNYIEDAIMTDYSIPCGAVEEFDEVVKVVEKNNLSFENNLYKINLRGHGALLMGKNLEDLKNVKYIGRMLPERMDV